MNPTLNYAVDDENFSWNKSLGLSKEKYLYWRDDTHWNHNGIYEAMSYVSDIIKK